MMKLCLAAALVALIPTQARARSCSEPVAVFTGEDISGGAVTSAAIDTNGVVELVVGVDLVDANDGVTNIRLTFTESNASGGTFRTVVRCGASAGTLDCVQMKINWPPQTDGKNYTIPIPHAYRFTKITVIPTGHGASDTIGVTFRVCT